MIESIHRTSERINWIKKIRYFLNIVNIEVLGKLDLAKATEERTYILYELPILKAWTFFSSQTSFMI